LSGRRVLAIYSNLLPPSSVQIIPMIKAAYTIYHLPDHTTSKTRKEKSV